MYQVIKECQNWLALWIVPDSEMTDKQCLSKLLSLLDNRNLVTTIREVEKYPFKEDDPSFEYLFNDFVEWAIPTFAESTPYSSLQKLSDEIAEVMEAFATRDTYTDGEHVLCMEYADCLMCIIDSAARSGISIEAIKAMFKIKLRINKKRGWIKNIDNTYSHIKILQSEPCTKQNLTWAAYQNRFTKR